MFSRQHYTRKLQKSHWRYNSNRKPDSPNWATSNELFIKVSRVSESFESVSYLQYFLPLQDLDTELRGIMKHEECNVSLEKYWNTSMYNTVFTIAHWFYIICLVFQVYFN